MNGRIYMLEASHSDIMKVKEEKSWGGNRGVIDVTYNNG